MKDLGFANAAVVETVKMGDNVTDKNHRAYVSKIEVTYE